MDKLSFIIPCFNNQENIDDLLTALIENEKHFSSISIEYILVDDASKDKTVEALKKWQNKHLDKIKILQLTKNIGSHKAVFKGLKLAKGDCIIVMAADLQDPPELSLQMFNNWKKGSKVVVAVKNNPLPVFSELFHNIMRSVFVKNAPKGSFDYVLFDKLLLQNLQTSSLRNCNLFYRIIDIQPDFSILTYEKKERKKGKSGWTFSKKILFFIENIFSYFISSTGVLK